LFESYLNGKSTTDKLLIWLRGQNLAAPILLITHQSNITALFGVFPAFGDVFVIHREPNGALTLVGRIRTLVRN
ncbi:MAG: histidine phosphatase family protein, partial [Pontibacterium sp.]